MLGQEENVKMDTIIEGCKILSATINQTTLVAGTLITISVTLYEKIVKNQSGKVKTYIALSWCFMALSILLGFLCEHFLSVYLDDTTYLDQVNLYEFLHFLCFFIGIVCLILYGYFSFIKVETKQGIVQQNTDSWRNPTTDFPNDKQEVLISHNGEKYLCIFDSSNNKYISKSDPAIHFSPVNSLYWKYIGSPEDPPIGQ